MESKSTQNFTDEMLSYLYSSTLFQSISEENQQAFISKYKNNKHFHEILKVAQYFQGVINEVEQFVHPVSEEERQFLVRPKKKIIDCIKIEKNVLHVSFEHFHKDYGPLIVCLQQGDEMLEVECLSKGIILTLFDLCYQLRRNLIIVTFSNNINTILFEYGNLSLKQFEQFLNIRLKGEAAIFPVLNHVVQLFNKVGAKDHSELIFVTNNHFIDYDENAIKQFEQFFKQQKIAVSAIAWNEETFNRQPFHFLEKVYFVNE